MISVDAVKTISLKQEIHYKNVQNIALIQNNIINVLIDIIKEQHVNFPKDIQNEIETILTISNTLLNTPTLEKQETVPIKQNVVPFRKKPDFKVV